MKCSAARKLVYKHIDGDLDSRLEDQFHQHLRSCGNCSREYQEVSEDHRLLSGSVVALPVSPGFVPAVMARLRAVEVWKTNDGYHLILSGRMVGWGLAGALVVLIGVVVSLQSLTMKQPVRHVEAPATPPFVPLPTSLSPPQENVEVPPPSPAGTVNQDTSKTPLLQRRTVPPKPVSPVAAIVVSSMASLMVRAEVPSPWKSMRSTRSIHMGELVRTSGSLAKVTTQRGDRLWLNRSTVVQFRGKEIALFRGELFVVAQRSSRGLAIRTPGTTTTVHGTRFNVRLLRDAVQVTVVEGKVEVGTSGGIALLGASQQVIASPGAPPSKPEVVNVQPVIGWTGMCTPEAKSEATEASHGPTDITFTVKVDGESLVGEVPQPTCIVTMDYGAGAPQNLTLTTTITDAKGKVVLQREETLADEQHRYRVKKVVLDRLPPGEYVGKFKLVAGNAEIAREVRFSVR